MLRADPEFYEFGPFRMYPAEGSLCRDGKPIALTPKAFETLLTLVRQSGRLVTKAGLMEAVWPDSFVEEGNLAFNISTLRKTMDEGPEHTYIETVPRRGYRFTASVRQFERHPTAVRSLAVLPFKSLGGDTADEYLGIGM